MGVTISQLDAGEPPYDKTTLLEFSVPDGSGGYASRKALLSDVAGLVLLARGTIASPVEYLDFDLPAGFASFSLKMIDFNFAPGGDLLSGAVSYDGGATFVCDPTNFDSYWIGYYQYQTALGVSAAASNPPPTDSLIAFSGTMVNFSQALPTIKGRVDLEIVPGSADTFPSFQSESFVSVGNVAGPSPIMLYKKTIVTLNSQATVTPSLGRVNFIRLLPYGNGDCNPPTSGETISAAKYFLWGIPS